MNLNLTSGDKYANRALISILFVVASQFFFKIFKDLYILLTRAGFFGGMSDIVYEHSKTISDYLLLWAGIILFFGSFLVILLALYFSLKIEKKPIKVLFFFGSIMVLFVMLLTFANVLGLGYVKEVLGYMFGFWGIFFLIFPFLFLSFQIEKKIIKIIFITIYILLLTSYIFAYSLANSNLGEWLFVNLPH